MKLFLLRHGEAEGYRVPDAERALTPRGHAQARQTGAWIASQVAAGERRHLLLASPYRRAQETAQAVNASLGWSLRAVDALTPDESPRRALAALQSLSDGCEALVIVSHMPLVAALDYLVEEGGAGAGQGFALAEVRAFELPELMAGGGERRAGFIPGLVGG